MWRVLPFVVFFALRAVVHATVPGPLAVHAACCEGDGHRALVRVLDVAAIGAEGTRRCLASRLPESLDTATKSDTRTPPGLNGADPRTQPIAGR
jgi:hypothetical protein